MAGNEETRHVLVVGGDASLREEFESALQGLRNVSVVTHYARDLRRGIEAARSLRADLVCVEFERDVRALRRFAQEVAASAPGVPVAGLYRRQAGSDETEESTLVLECFRAQVLDLLRRPLSSAELGQLFDRVFLREAPAVEARGKVISVVSNKGGVGKSTMAVSAATLLARRHPERVLLVDASLQLGVCASMLDLAPATTLVDAVRERDRLDPTLLRRLCARHACGLYLLAAPADAVAASRIDERGLSEVLTVARRAFDCVVVDTFPLLDSVVTAVLDLSDAVCVVLQGMVPSVLGGAAYLDVLTGLGVSPARRKLILNHNYQRFAGDLKPVQVADRLGCVVDHVIPYRKRLLEAANSGQPYALRAGRWSGFGRALRRLVAELERGLPTAGAATARAPESVDSVLGGTPSLDGGAGA